MAFLDKINQNDILLSKEDIQDNKRKENPNACIFVASLNKDVNDQELHSSVYQLFRNWGPVLSVKVFKDWLKRPYAFVQYESVEDCKAALREAPGNKLNGRHIRCEPARVNRSICLISLNHPFNKKKFIETQLSIFGEIENITNLQPHGKFHSVFIKYKYREDAIKAYLSLKFSDNNSSALKNLNHQWFIEWAANLDAENPYGVCGSSYRLDKSSIFVGNLPEDTEEQELRNVFSSFGTIINVHIVRKPHQTAKKVFAFIKYKHERDAADAIEHQNGTLFKEKTIRVCYRQHPSHKHATCSYNDAFLAPSCSYPMIDQDYNNLEDYSPMPPLVCYPYNLPIYEPYAPKINNLYQTSMDPYYQNTEDTKTSSSDHSPVTAPNTASVALPPNANYGYYLNTYPPIVYYNYSPYYQVNANLVKKN